MRFEFATAARVVFGQGTFAEVGPAAAGMGRRVFLVTGRSERFAADLVCSLESFGMEHQAYQAGGEPTVQAAIEAAGQARHMQADVVIGIGGGSAIDLAKVVAAMLTNTGDLVDYLEVVGKGRPIERACASWIAVPTTAGTGAEVTYNCVLTVPEHSRKVSVRSPLMLARLVVVDPMLTCSVPAKITAYTGMDALSQLIEPFVSTRANPFTDALCRQGIGRLARSIHTAYRSGQDIHARTDMALASLFSGMALANAGLGLVHGLAGPLGGLLVAPHGAICGRLLPFVMEANIVALARSDPASEALARYCELGRLLSGNPQADAADAVAWVYGLTADLDIPALSRWGLRPDQIPAMAQAAMQSSSTKRNPIQLGQAQIMEVLHKAL